MGAIQEGDVKAMVVRKKARNREFALVALMLAAMGMGCSRIVDDGLQAACNQDCGPFNDAGVDAFYDVTVPDGTETKDADADINALRDAAEPIADASDGATREAAADALPVCSPWRNNLSQCSVPRGFDAGDQMPDAGEHVCIVTICSLDDFFDDCFHTIVVPAPPSCVAACGIESRKSCVDSAIPCPPVRDNDGKIHKARDKYIGAYWETDDSGADLGAYSIVHCAYGRSR
jgi:hypothetical protein